MTRAKLALILLGTALLSAVVTAMLVSIFERQQEARLVFRKVVEVTAGEQDPSIWGQNYRGEYDAYTRTMRTADLVKYSEIGRYGGPDAYQKLDTTPELKRLFAGYPFAIDYREERGHLNALEDVKNTKRLPDSKPGTCITCKTPAVPAMMRELGVERFYATPFKDLVAHFDPQHSIACADCHDAQTMALTITRPAFREAMERRGVDLEHATRQEMRTYVCAQCHVEYYFKGDGKYLVFPWDNGLKIDDIETYYDQIGFNDWTHAETQTGLAKMQHPDFELWSTGIHARAGVACPDCHMSYKREAGVKITDHWIQSPLATPTNSCTTCHRVSEQELRARVLEAQDRTAGLLKRAQTTIVEAQDAIKEAMAKGASDQALQEARQLHRRAYVRWDFVASENSMGFHSPGEANRILGDSIDFARQAQLAARKLADAK